MMMMKKKKKKKKKMKKKKKKKEKKEKKKDTKEKKEEKKKKRRRRQRRRRIRRRRRPFGGHRHHLCVLCVHACVQQHLPRQLLPRRPAMGLLGDYAKMRACDMHKVCNGHHYSACWMGASSNSGVDMDDQGCMWACANGHHYSAPWTTIVPYITVLPAH